MKKGLLIGGAVLIVVIVAAVVFLFTGLGGVVKAAIEKAGSEVTQVKVTLNNAEVTPTEGRAALHGLVIGNPVGFQTDSAFKMGLISVTLDTATVTQDPIVIKEVVIADPEVIYELGAQGSNIDVIRNNVERFGSGGKTSESKGPKVVIENLYVRGGKVNVSAVPLGGTSMTASLPEIHLQDIGKDKGGASYGEVAEKVMTALTSQIGGFVAGLDLGGVLKGVEVMPDALKGLTGGAAEKAGEATEGVAKGAGEAVKKLLGN
jgi:hypothetical protein